MADDELEPELTPVPSKANALDSVTTNPIPAKSTPATAKPAERPPKIAQNQAINNVGQLVLEKYSLYETKTKYYIVASNQADSRHKILKIDRTPSQPTATPVTATGSILASTNILTAATVKEKDKEKEKEKDKGKGKEDSATVDDPRIGSSSEPTTPTDKAVPITADSSQAEEDEGDEDRNEEEYGLNITEDSTVYDKEQIQDLLETLSAGNVGGIQRVENLFYGIAGFIRFTGHYYIILIKSRTPVALVGGHYIYHCEETVFRPIVPFTGTKAMLAEETRLMKEFERVDLSKNFYFSYTYNLTHTLQHNLTTPLPPLNSTSTNPPHSKSGKPKLANSFSTLNDKFLWNRHLLKPAFGNSRGRSGVEGEVGGSSGGGLGEGRKSPWLLALVYGFVDQAKLSVFGKTVYITLIARRSRHFAGARFLKRGINDQGYVANDVETEQIVSEALTTSFHLPAPVDHSASTSSDTTGDTKRRIPNPRYTSFVQVRGSIPLYWSQESTNMSPKPPIELTIVDPYFSAAALHFDDMLGRYGGPITVLNLIKQKERAPRESKLLPEFKECIDYLNQFLEADRKIVYIPWDIAAANKQRDKDVIGILEDIAEESLEGTNFFHTGPEPTWYSLNGDTDAPPYRSTPLLQSGVVRTNCIDCLDRTNAAQFVLAKAALGHQLHALGIIHHPRLPFDSDAVDLLTDIFHDHGDTIALQYGGSHLVNTMETYRRPMWTSHSRDMIENLRRYYSNSFVDADKQAAIDLFLGVPPTHPNLPSSTATRRSYRKPFSPAHLEFEKNTRAAEERLGKTVEEEEGNYWQSYYRPKLFTEMSRHFAYKVNSTSKYTNTGGGDETIDHSPFVPRLTARVAAPAPSLNMTGVGGVRRWISHRGHSKSALSSKLRLMSLAPPPLPAPPPAQAVHPTEALIKRLLNPSVDAMESTEYISYIDQFSHLSLSQDLSEKDEILYQGFAGGDGGNLKIDKGSLNLYDDVVKLSASSNVVGFL